MMLRGSMWWPGKFAFVDFLASAYHRAMKKKQNDSVPALAAHIAAELRVIMSRFRRRLREVDSEGFTSPQLLALSRLDREGPATVSTLARAEGIRPQSMGANIAVLEEAGLVKRKADPTDGRQAILSLTPAANDFIKASRAARDNWLSRTVVARLTPTEQKELARGIELLQRLFDD